jgi:hypothetical protein
LGYRLSLDLRRYRNKSYAEMEIPDSSLQLGLRLGQGLLIIVLLLQLK